MSDPIKTQAVILMRQGDTTIAVRVPVVTLRLTSIVDEPEVFPVYGFYRQPTVTGYEVEATGIADAITIWEGPDPFTEELTPVRAEVEP